MNKTERGLRFEQMAQEHLAARGLKLIARNFRCAQGEIDLIMKDGDCLVFVEVRYRNSPSYGSALESIDGRKQARIARAAQAYLQRMPHCGGARFDVVAIDRNSIDWRKAAFETSNA